MSDTESFEDGYTKKVLVYLLRDNLEGNKEVLLGIHHKQGKRNAPGGKVGDKEEFEEETSEEAAIRETLEETGLKILNPILQGHMTFTFINSPTVECDIFVATEWTGELTENEELTDLQWFPIDNLPEEDMWESDLEWLDYILHGRYTEGTVEFEENNQFNVLIEVPLEEYQQIS